MDEREYARQRGLHGTGTEGSGYTHPWPDESRWGVLGSGPPGQCSSCLFL